MLILVVTAIRVLLSWIRISRRIVCDYHSCWGVDSVVVVDDFVVGFVVHFVDCWDGRIVG